MTIIRGITGLSIAGLLLVTVLYSAASGTSPRARRFAIDYNVMIDKIPTLADRVEIWMPVPHDDAYQSISRLDVSTDDYSYREGFKVTTPKTKILTGEYGNRIFHLRLDSPGIKPSMTLTMRFVVKRQEHLRLAGDSAAAASENASDKDPNIQRWLEPDRLAPIDDKIRGWAQEVVDAAGAKTDLEKARAIYNHIVATVKYDKTGQGWGRGDIYYARDARRGNCTDFHAIFIGYARALGIPARFSIGLAASERPRPRRDSRLSLLGRVLHQRHRLDSGRCIGSGQGSVETRVLLRRA